MITLDETPKKKHNGKFEVSLSGLSTDSKPTVNYVADDGTSIPLGNGSSFMELDTKAIKFYDEEHNTWV